jgi:hypothetical protein
MRNVLLLLLIIAPIFVLAGVFLKVKDLPFGNVVLGMGLVLELICAVGFIARSIAARRGRE